jgi:hypothetical protein
MLNLLLLAYEDSKPGKEADKGKNQEAARELDHIQV